MIWIFVVYALLGSIFYFFFLQPLVPILLLKLKLGDEAYFYFFPFQGLFRLLNISKRKHNDPHHIMRQEVLKNPKLKFILSNFQFQPLVVFLTPEYYKEILIDHHHYNKYRMIEDERIFSKSIQHTSDLSKWKHQRYLLGPQFTFEALRSRIPLINSVVKNNLITVKGQSQVNTRALITNIPSQIMVDTFFGDDIKGVKVNGKDFKDEILETHFEMIIQTRFKLIPLIKFSLLGQKGWSFFPTKNEKQIYRRVTELNRIVNEVVQRRVDLKKEQMKQGIPLKNDDFLDLEVNEHLRNNEVTVEEIVHNFQGLFSAGSNSTSVTIETSLWYLAQQPETQQELLEEITEIVGEKFLDVQFENLSRLQKLGAFINEVMRMRNSAQGVHIKQAKKDLKINDFLIKKAQWVWFLNIRMHYGPDVFEDPLRFNHKRWLEDDPIKYPKNKPFVFIPFSAAGRNCIGQYLALMEIKIALCHFIRNFTFELVPGINYGFKTSSLYLLDPSLLIFKERT